ncbi:hypothetical protein SO694_00037298 [Aureococcus anophagefferens]|uniref:Uncharacterized protein n=1 Tax=Aureococcus anophagefferens TaxID=44056 RepID=A0ABR1FL34_AURAN
MSTTATDGTVEITMTHAVTGEAASSWKHKAGRREGPEHYRFGDLTKTLVHKVAGPAEPAPDDRSPELAVTSVKCRVRVPWAQRLWDDAPLCRKLRELGLGRAEAGGAVEVDARTFGASLSERDAITCLRHADGVNGSLSKRPPLAMPRYCGSLDACDALRGAFDACFGAGSFDGAEKQWADAPLGARLALALARDEARRAVASSVAADVLGALKGEAALCGAAFFAFLADGERGDDFRELRYDRDAKSVDAVGRFRFRFRPGTPALDVLSHHETGVAALTPPPRRSATLARASPGSTEALPSPRFLRMDHIVDEPRDSLSSTRLSFDDEGEVPPRYSMGRPLAVTLELSPSAAAPSPAPPKKRRRKSQIMASAARPSSPRRGARASRADAHAYLTSFASYADSARRARRRGGPPHR